MQCPRCNTPLAAGASFCGVCGNPVSIQSGSGPGAQGAQPSAPHPVHDGVTMAVPFRPDMPVAQAAQPSQRAYPTPSPAPQQAGWPPQQPAYQPQGAYMPGSMNSTGAGRASSMSAPKRRKRKWPLYVLLVFVLLVGVLAGSWFLGVRPYLNNLAKTQITQAIGDAQSQLLLFEPLLPTGPSIIHLSEQQMNSYLSTHASDQLQHLQMTVTPAGLDLTFTVDGFACAIIAVPIAVNGTIQVTNVQTQGVLGLVLSGDELTSILNTSLPNLVQQMNRKIDKVTLQNHEMDIQMH